MEQRRLSSCSSDCSVRRQRLASEPRLMRLWPEMVCRYRLVLWVEQDRPHFPALLPHRRSSEGFKRATIHVVTRWPLRIILCPRVAENLITCY